MSEQQPNIGLVESSGISAVPLRRFSHEAMATTFEILAVHDDPLYAEQASWAAFRMVDKLEADLSRFIENSDVSRISNLKAGETVVVGLETFECLQICARLYDQTDGAFDVTVADLVDFWLDDNSRTLSAAPLQRGAGTIHNLELDETSHTIKLVSDSPIRLDLGAIGKGFAVDKMAQVLRDWDINVALIHGGFSSVLAMGTPAGTQGWPITLRHPLGGRRVLAKLYLQNQTIGASGLQKGPHIVNPKTGRPVKRRLAAWAVVADATMSDAISTAFMIMPLQKIKRYCANHPDTMALIIREKQHRQTGSDNILWLGRWERLRNHEA